MAIWRCSPLRTSVRKAGLKNPTQGRRPWKSSVETFLAYQDLQS
jgi:hypothetical protein